jgi:alkaline phosphatase
MSNESNTAAVRASFGVLATAILIVVASCLGARAISAQDHVKDLQKAAVASGRAAWGHWGANPDKYSAWISHTNRLIPVYTFGMTLDAVNGPHSVYRDAQRLRELYGRLPEGSLNPAATYFDQTDVYRLQQQAAAAGKKYIVLIVFDGMDWQTTRAAAVYRAGNAGYGEGRGSGLHFQDYRGAATDFGCFVTSPHSTNERVDVDAQVVLQQSDVHSGGYDARLGGGAPWESPTDPDYLTGKSHARPDAVTDSASAMTSLTTGIKTYNRAINIDPHGRQVATIAHRLQSERGFAIGVVTSVPISHATPAAAYAHNVSRDDYQDLTRDLLGLPSIAHRSQPLPGVDVLLGAGWGEKVTADEKQGQNFLPGNKFITDEDLKQVDKAGGGRYRVVQRTAGSSGRQLLSPAADDAARQHMRLFGLFGVKGGHLPFRTADGGFDPTPDVKPAEKYSPADIDENPTLADMTQAALTVLATNSQGFWLMIEAGDVDWANHSNNIDNSIGAVISGDEAFRAVALWAEANHCWDQTAVIVTADHGHYLVLSDPSALVGPAKE